MPTKSSTVILATAGYDHRIRYWDANTGACTRAIKFDESQVNALQISPNKHFLSAAGNPNVHLYDVSSSSDSPVISFEGHTSNVTGLGFQKDTQWLYSCSEDGTVRIWDLRAPEAQRTYQCRSAVHAVVLHPNQRSIICGDQNGSVKTWDLLAGDKCRSDLAVSPESPMRSLSISYDGTLLIAGSHKGKVHVLNEVRETKDYDISTNFQAHSDYLLKCVISPDANVVATTSADHSIKLWDPANGYALARPPLKQHQRWVWDLAFSADSSFMVTASSDQSAKLWDLRSGEVIRNYAGHSLAVTCVALNDTSD